MSMPIGTSNGRLGTLCEELGVMRQTLYRHVSPYGELRRDGESDHAIIFNCSMNDLLRQQPPTAVRQFGTSVAPLRLCQMDLY